MTLEEMCCLEKDYESFKKEVFSTLESMKSTLGLMKKNNEQLKSDISKNLKETFKVTQLAQKTVKDHESFLSPLKECLENCEDTFLNVLVAIRQNEYLQATYPPQLGYPEMKVTGPHPSKLKKKESKK